MAKPTLLIGIGTSGLRVLEETQKLYFEHTGKNKPGNVEYLYLETDESKYPSTTVIKNEIKRAYLDLTDKRTKINNLKDTLPKEESFWVPEHSYMKDAGKGAAGMPAFGRAALWTSPNFSNVKEAITRAFDRINNHNVTESDNTTPAVFITGSLTGGTGSGVFIDIAYMIKNQIAGIQEVYGLFLLPGREYMGKDNILYCNALSSLVALEKFNTATQKYKMTLPNSISVDLNELPFELTHFISQDGDDGILKVRTLGGLYKVSGLWMFLNIFGLREKRDARLTDSKGSAFIDKYGTFGISAVQYPKRQLEELLGIDLSISLLKRWIDPLAYYNKGIKTEIKTVKLKVIKDTSALFESALKSSLETLDATLVDGNNRILSDLKVKAKNINNKEFDHEASEYHYIKKWFSSNGENNYYTAVKNNLKLAEDELIQKIYELVNTTLNKTENLQIIKIQLEAIVSSIKSITGDYWNSLGISPKPAKWENLLEQQINIIVKRKYKVLGEQDAVLFDRLKSLFNLMKLHLMGDKMLAIRNNLTDKEDALKTFNGEITLPKGETINTLVKEIRSVIDSSSGKTSERNNSKTLQTRYNDIISELRDTTIPILRVYKDGSSEDAFKRTYDTAKTNYFSKSDKKITSKTAIIGENSLWDYLNIASSKLHDQLYRDCITNFESDVIKHECVDNMDVSAYIKNNPKDGGKMALRAKTPLIMVNNDNKTNFVKGKGIPQLVIGKNSIQINSVFDSLSSGTDSYMTSYKNDEDGVWLNEDINNIVIFYVEQGYMSNGNTFNPVKHLKHINDIKKIYNSEKERYINVRNVDEKVWHGLRNPYLTFEEFNKFINEK